MTITRGPDTSKSFRWVDVRKDRKESWKIREKIFIWIVWLEGKKKRKKILVWFKGSFPKPTKKSIRSWIDIWKGN